MPGIYGRDLLLAAHDRAEEAERLQKRQDLDRRAAVQARQLGKVMCQLTEQKIPHTDAGATFTPAKDKQNRAAFKRELVLGDDFEVEQLRLKASGSPSSHWFKYTLSYIHPASVMENPQEEIIMFSAHRDAGMTELPPSETNLWIANEVPTFVPVAYQSPEYTYLFHVAKLFLPEVVDFV